jgi:hypothetical protein
MCSGKRKKAGASLVWTEWGAAAETTMRKRRQETMVEEDDETCFCVPCFSLV